MSVEPAAAVHQVVSTLERDDAVGNEVCLIAQRLRRSGLESDIFTVLQRGNEPAPVHDLSELLDGPPPAVVLYHFAVASPATARLAASALPVVLVYHNVTPEEFFWGIDRDHFEACRGAAADVELLTGRALLALGHSQYSRRDLADRGFERTGTFPLLLDTSRFMASLAATSGDDPSTPGSGDPVLLTVGRIAPNKCIEDCIRLLHAVRRDVAPRARLWIAGDGGRMPRYVEALHRLTRRLDLDGAVEWLGRVPRDELVRRFRSASLYVSMSEHEGFGGPLVEAMLAGLPVLAYDAAAVAETLGGAGVLLPVKDMALAAEVVAALLEDGTARRACVDRGKQRAVALDADHAFLELSARLADAGVAVAT